MAFSASQRLCLLLAVKRDTDPVPQFLVLSASSAPKGHHSFSLQASPSSAEVQSLMAPAHNLTKVTECQGMSEPQEICFPVRPYLGFTVCQLDIS